MIFCIRRWCTEVWVRASRLRPGRSFFLRTLWALADPRCNLRPMTATNHSDDFFKVVELNPLIPPIVADPRDPRGQSWFGFESKGQRLLLDFGFNPPPPGVRVLYSFDLDYFANAGFAAPSIVKPHGALQMGNPLDTEMTYTGNHDRSFVALWIDPTGAQPGPGQTVQVSVRAWR